MAYAVLSLALGRRPAPPDPARLRGATAIISAWISNTATTAMMFGIGALDPRGAPGAARPGATIDPRYATGLMLMTSFAASIGGLATPVGTPPNLIGIGFIRSQLGVEIAFFRWMLIGVPVVVVLFGVPLLLPERIVAPAGRAGAAGGGAS